MSTAFESFVTVHQYQLAGIPEELWQTLFMKLGEDYLDAGNFVELHQGDPLKGYSLHVKSDTTLKKHSDIFLVDHAWTTTPETAKEELIKNIALMDRLENLMDIEQIEAPEDSEDEDEEVEKPSEDLIQLVASQANVSKKVAEAALIAENNEVINAIMTLTIDPEAKAEADRLHDQVMNQVLQSGKPQEKEEKENKERLERRAQREQEWLKQRAENIYEKMWSFIQTYTYSILQQHDGQPVSQTAWYINDEVGSAICHSTNPNVACAPFIFSRGAHMIPYSIFYPIKDIEAGEIISCDLVPKNFERDVDRTAYLFAFQDRVLLTPDIEEKRKELTTLFNNKKNKAQSTINNQALSSSFDSFKKTTSSETSSVTVYTDASFVQQFLKLENVKFTNDPKKADIIWSSQDFQDWDSLLAHQAINQIPNEGCITFKHNLAQLIKEAYGAPEWFPPTYNIMTELSEFVGDYLENEEKSENNLWITKPWNMARGLGLDITRNLAEIIRQHDSPIPKIAQRYLLSPCLYNGKKFDLRYIVLVARNSSNQFVACVYNMFWTRLANKKFDLEDLTDYERQFTVMNYSNYQMTQLDDKSFIHNMEKQYNIQWSTIQEEIHAVIKDVLAAAANTPQPLGFATNNTGSEEYSAFSVYGFDVMLTSDFKPVLLEVNFSPDCTRACQYDPEFVNNIFSVVDSRFDSFEKGLNAFTVL